MDIYQELTILGLLKGSPKHGYEIKQLLKNVLGLFASVETTSIYYPLKNLKEHGYVEKEVSRKGSRPEKYIYKLTPKGEERLKKLLADNFLSLRRPFVNVDLSLYFLPYLDKNVFEKKINIRIRALEKTKRWLRKRLDRFDSKEGRHLKKILEHNLKLINAEIEFTQEILDSPPF